MTGVLIYVVHLPDNLVMDSVPYSDLVMPETPTFLGKGGFGNYVPRTPITLKELYTWHFYMGKKLQSKK